MIKQQDRFNLLLVEDNPGDALLVREMLDEAHTTPAVHVAGCLEEALSLLGDANYDAVLLDLSLPDSHGLDTLHTVCEEAKKAPIVVLTGLDDRDAGIEAVRSGAQDYLIKGQFGAPLLERAVRYAVERKRIEEEERHLSQMKDDFVSIFDRFYQAESAAKRAGVGTGLGLYIAKGIVEAHGGTMGVRSKHGSGSTFFFTLPRHANSTVTEKN